MKPNKNNRIMFIILCQPKQNSSILTIKSQIQIEGTTAQYLVLKTFRAKNQYFLFQF